MKSDFVAMIAGRLQPDSQAIVPPGAPGWVSESLIHATIETWQPFIDRTLTPNDALAILINVGELFEVAGLTTGGDE